MYDYIIVGQGIGGSVLSYTLFKKGKKILVVDKGNEGSSSSVAAGIYNPITGKRMVKSWKADEIFPFLQKFYKEMEGDFGGTFNFEKPIYKPYASLEEQNFWVSNSISGKEDFVNTDVPKEKYSQYVNNNFGGLEMQMSGFVDVNKMLLLTKEYLIKNNVYKKDDFDIKDLQTEEGCLIWKKHKAKKIIFCEGEKAIDNPYFNWLPFTPAKGELLTVRIKNFPESSIINKNIFVLPVGDGLFKVGATFEWVRDKEITENAARELMIRLEQLIKVPYEIIKQEAGIRPTVKDRRPLIGFHPENKKIGIFNGLGTKGISLAPFFSNEFYNFLENDGTLDSTVNIQRFYSLYYDSKE